MARWNTRLCLQMLCLFQSQSASHCALTDVKCQCESDVTINYVSRCVVDNCTLSDAIGSFSPATVWLEVSAKR